MKDKNILCKFKLFDGISPDDIDLILSAGREEKYDNEKIILEDTPQENDLFVVLEGSVSVEIESSSPREGSKQIQLTTLRVGGVFGEVAFLETSHRSASVRAVGKTDVLRVNGKKLYEVFERNNHIAYIMMKNLAGILAQRLIETNFKLRDSGLW